LIVVSSSRSWALTLSRVDDLAGLIVGPLGLFDGVAVDQPVQLRLLVRQLRPLLVELLLEGEGVDPGQDLPGSHDVADVHVDLLELGTLGEPEVLRLHRGQRPGRGDLDGDRSTFDGGGRRRRDRGAAGGDYRSDRHRQRHDRGDPTPQVSEKVDRQHATPMALTSCPA
jgi:hypothetical protein